VSRSALHITGLAAAATKLLAMVRTRLTSQPVVVVGITGPVGSGKTTLSTSLAGSGIPAVVISTDNYLPDYHTIEPSQRDLPEHADLARLHDDLSTLRSQVRAMVPIWSFHTHQREGERPIDPAPLVICEGIHALGDAPSRVLDIKVYVDAPRDVRWNRWEEIEKKGLRGFGVERARVHFDTIAEPTFDLRAQRYRDIADVVVLNH
jgi:uridine kinase